MKSVPRRLRMLSEGVCQFLITFMMMIEEYTDSGVVENVTVVIP